MAVSDTAATVGKYGVRHLATDACDIIREKIITGEFPPGMQLSERTLAEEVGSSRTPIRVALANLTADGLVEQIPHIGVFVRKLSFEEAVALVELRRALETAAAASAATKAKPAECAQLEELGSQIEDARKSGNIVVRSKLEFKFHRLISKLADNKEISQGLTNTLYLTILCPESMQGGVLQHNYEPRVSHVEVAKAIATGDARQALLTMWDHFDDLHQRLLAMLSKHE